MIMCSALAGRLFGKNPFASLPGMVGEEGLEPSRLAPLVPKTSVSTKFHHSPLF